MDSYSRKVLILVLSCKLKRTVEARVEDRVRRNLCLAVVQDEEGNDVDCNNAVYHRGRCKKCHGRWYYQRLQLTDDQKAKLDSDLVEEGQLLQHNGARQYRRKDALSRFVKRVKGAG